MRRALVVLTLLAVALPAVAAGQSARPVPDQPPLKAMLAACNAGPTDAERFAIFSGSMPAMAGTVRMAMRFDLYVRAPGTRTWTRVKAKGFGRWERSQPGKSGFVYAKRVERMRQDAEYRTSVRFRWYDAAGLQRAALRRTPVCLQPDQRPNLRLRAFEVRPGPDATTATYVLGIENLGRTAAGAFEVTIAGTEALQTVPGLPAGERTTVELVAPQCATDRPVVVRLDPSDVVDESNERDNRSRWACGGR